MAKIRPCWGFCVQRARNWSSTWKGAIVPGCHPQAACFREGNRSGICPLIFLDQLPKAKLPQTLRSPVHPFRVELLIDDAQTGKAAQRHSSLAARNRWSFVPRHATANVVIGASPEEDGDNPDAQDSCGPTRHSIHVKNRMPTSGWRLVSPHGRSLMKAKNMGNVVAVSSFRLRGAAS